jgi:hypothetical protein
MLNRDTHILTIKAYVAPFGRFLISAMFFIYGMSKLGIFFGWILLTLCSNFPFKSHRSNTNDYVHEECFYNRRVTFPHCP